MICTFEFDVGFEVKGDFSIVTVRIIINNYFFLKVSFWVAIVMVHLKFNITKRKKYKVDKSKVFTQCSHTILAVNWHLDKFHEN